MAEPKNITNWKVITLCFIGAATFWFFSALGKDYSYRIKYPIEFIFDTDSLIAVKPLPEYVDIDVSGGGWDLFKESFWFGVDPVKFELENPAAIRFLTRPTILPILTEELYQYRVNFLFTDTLFIDIDRKSSQLVNLEIDSTKVSLEEDYRIVSTVTISPDTARIFGPTSFLDSLEAKYFMTLDFDEIDRDFSNAVSLNLPEDFDIYSVPQNALVQFQVERFLNKEVSSSVELINFPEDSSIYIANPEITIRYVVIESEVVDYTANDFNVIVDYGMLIESDSTAPAIVIVQPEQALEVTISPDTLLINYAQ